MRLLPLDYAVRNLGRSPLRLVLSILGSTLVVLLTLASAAFVRGMEQSLNLSGGERNVILLGAGSSESVERSEMSANTGSLAAASISGIKERLGVAYVSPEVHMMLPIQLEREDSESLRVVMRGITSTAFLVHPRVRIFKGRAPRSGADELMIGKLAASSNVEGQRMAVGRTLWIDNRAWEITGHFEAPGTTMEAEIWVPLSDLQLVAKRDNLSCVIMTLDSAEFADVDVFTKQRLDLELIVMRETDYYAKLNDFYGPVRAMVWVTALLIALGGLFGGLNTMYAAFAARARELGALQTLGYTRFALVVSLIQESVLATISGALLAIALGLILLDGLAITFSMGAFGLYMDTQVVLIGALVGLTLGVVGALPPAWRCLRMPIAEALKSV